MDGPVPGCNRARAAPQVSFPTPKCAPMRVFAAAALPLLLVLMMPAAQADPVDCPEKSYTIGQYERHTVAVHSDCTVDIVLNEGIICLGGGVGQATYGAGPAHVTSYYCKPPPGSVPEVAEANRDIYLPEMVACTWTGSYKPYVETPVVTVWMYTCDERPPT